MPTCQLCLKDLELRNSHIVPEFLHKKLYNNKGHLAAINGKGNKGYKPLQQGLREYLFCDDCEQHFNKYCEKPFETQWINANPLPDPWNVFEPYWISVNYSSFKLFHLSVLFRASVSSLANFAEVSLGSHHQDRLREMILDRDPGKFWQYPIFGMAVIHHKTKKLYIQLQWFIEQDIRSILVITSSMVEFNGRYLFHRTATTILNTVLYKKMVVCLFKQYIGMN